MSDENLRKLAKLVAAPDRWIRAKAGPPTKEYSKEDIDKLVVQFVDMVDVMTLFARRHRLGMSRTNVLIDLAQEFINETAKLINSDELKDLARKAVEEME